MLRLGVVRVVRPPPGAPPTPLRADASHYLVPDADALVAYLDFLESPSARDVVLLASEAKAAHALGDARVSRAIRALCGDRRGRVKLFPNDHCRATSVVNPARRREILRSLPFDALPSSSAAVAALVHPVLRAAAWYASHAVRGAFPVVVLSDTIRSDRLDGAVPTGVEVLDADAYSRGSTPTTPRRPDCTNPSSPRAKRVPKRVPSV